jgi:hypothetical protein
MQDCVDCIFLSYPTKTHWKRQKEIESEIFAIYSIHMFSSKRLISPTQKSKSVQDMFVRLCDFQAVLYLWWF